MREEKKKVQPTMRREEKSGTDNAISHDGEGNGSSFTLNSPVHCLTHEGDVKVGVVIGFYRRLKVSPSPSPSHSHSHDGESVHGGHHWKYTTAADRGRGSGSGEGSGRVGVEGSSSRCALLGHH